MGITIVQPSLSKSQSAIEVYKGQSKNIKLIVITPTQDVDGNPLDAAFDLNGCTITFSIRRDPDDADALVTKVSSDVTQVQVLQPTTNGIAYVFLKPADTKYLDPGKYFYDIWLTEPNGDESPIVEVSEFIVAQPVTRLKS